MPIGDSIQWKRFVDSSAFALRSHIRLGCLVLGGIVLAASGCSPTIDSPDTSAVGSSVTSFNGLGEYGVEWNGLSWNGQMWNGLGWNGQMWNGQMWNGLGWNGQMWNGQMWNGQMWNGIGWNGQMWNGQMWNGVPGQDAPTFTALHNWVNHQDVNGNGTPTAAQHNLCGPPSTYSAAYLNDSADLDARLDALSYWVSCACPAGFSTTFSDTHGRGSRTYVGGLGFGETWCTGTINDPIPQGEIEMVSACLMARVNTKGKHIPLSLRSTEASTALSDGERMTHQRDVAWHWGNLFAESHYSNDTTTAYSATNMASSGGSWRNSERFSCVGPGASYSAKDAIGRNCDVTVCADDLSFLGRCDSDKKRLVAEAIGGRTATAAYDPDPVAAGGLAGIHSIVSDGATTLHDASYRGLSWRVLSVYGALFATLENPIAAAPSTATKMWVQDESIDTYTTQYCTSASKCEGVAPTGNGQKLINLTSSQTITVNLHNGGSGYNMANPGNEPMTVAIRYSNPNLLGPGQCDPDGGCAATLPSQCLSGVRALNGSCSGGFTIGKSLKIWTMNPMASNPGFTHVHGTTHPHSKNIFPPTSDANKYSTAYIYPVFVQNGSASIGAGRSSTAPNNDTLRIKLTGESADGSTAPQLDMAYFFPGPPPPGADCKGTGGCWLYSGPNRGYSSTAGWLHQYNTPYLPAGTYEFKLLSVSGNPDLYCKIDGPATTTDYTFRSIQPAGVNEVCTINLPQGGFVGLGIHANSGVAAFYTITGKNN